MSKLCFAMSKLCLLCFVMLSSALLCPSSDSVCQVPLRYARGPIRWLPLPLHWIILPSSAPWPPRGCWRTEPSKGTCVRERRAKQNKKKTPSGMRPIYVVYKGQTRESQTSTNCIFIYMHVPVLNEIECYHALLKMTKVIST